MQKEQVFINHMFDKHLFGNDNKTIRFRRYKNLPHQPRHPISASDNEVHPNMLTRWKTEATNNFHLLFENENAKIRKQSKEYEAQIDELHRQIGKLTAQYDWMKKKLCRKIPF